MRIVPGLERGGRRFSIFARARRGRSVTPRALCNNGTGSRIVTFICDEQRSDRRNEQESMTDPKTDIASLKARLAKAGLTSADLAWFDSLEWRDANVPPPAPDQVESYKRCEAALNADIAHLGLLERSSTLQSKLAAAIGARLADLRDRADGDED
jgi:hypothetical protein